MALLASVVHFASPVKWLIVDFVGGIAQKTLIEDGHIGNYQVPTAPLTFYFPSLAHARPIDACTCSPIVIPSIGTEHSTAICN